MSDSEDSFGTMRIPFKTFPADRISDDKTVSDRIHNAEVAMRSRHAKIADGILVAAGRLRRGYGELHPGIENFAQSFERAAREIKGEA